MAYDKSTKDRSNVVHCSHQSERKPPPGVPAPKGGLLYLVLTAREPSVKPLATATTAASGGNREELLGLRPAGCERQRSRRWEPQPGLVLVISVLHPLSSRNTRSLALNPDIRPFQSFLFCATSGTLLFTGMKRLFLPAVSCFLMKTPPCS